MYILLDEERFYVTHVITGSVQGGLSISKLPPDMTKAIFYQWMTKPIPQEVQVPDIDEVTGLQKLDEEERPLTKTVVEYYDVTDWYFNEDKYNKHLSYEFDSKKEIKKKEINEACQEIIYKGTDVVLDKTKPEEYSHFSFTLEDQTNIKCLYDKVQHEGIEVVPYHVDKERWRLFTAEEIITLYHAMDFYKNYNLTLCNFIKDFIDTLEDDAAVDSVIFSIDILPEEYKIELNEILGIV